MVRRGKFAEVTSLPVFRTARGALVLPRKFIEGMNRYADAWPEPVAAFMHPAERITDNLDQVEVRPEELRFEVVPVRFDSPELRTRLARCGFVHWGPHDRLHDLADALQRAHVPNVYCTEYTLRTRMQIIEANGEPRARRLRRHAWELLEERRVRRDVARAGALEANGTPTYDAYAELNRRNLLYFDTRTSEAMLPSDAALERRLRRLRNDRPLHLVFSGRLVPMKGPLDLVEVADELRRRRVEFRLSICGAGELEGPMREQIDRRGLARSVQLLGSLPFAEALVPFVREEADLFVCCHKQGDPSCTYLETFACGVPIVGYRNEAFAGLMRLANAGWAVRMHDVVHMADLIARLSRRPHELAEKSRAALAFAREHTFERTFDRRTAFFHEVAFGRAPRASSPPLEVAVGA
jgi:glycosyltransferase involved in cell wall biosynthesis